MRLTVVGCAGSFPSPTSPASSYLLEADDEAGRTWRVVLDLGSGASGPLQAYCDPAQLDAIALTHLHADHVADMAVLTVLLRYRPKGPVLGLPVHGPAGTSERLSAIAGDDPATGHAAQYDVRRLVEGVPVVAGPLTLVPVRVEHPVEAYGFRVSGPSQDDPGRTVTLAYTGDTDDSPALDDLARDVDLLLCEAGFPDDYPDLDRGIHLTGRRAGAVAARTGARRLVLTHLSRWADPERAVACARDDYDGPVTVASPGDVFVL